MKKVLPVLTCLFVGTAAILMAAGCDSLDFNSINPLTLTDTGVKGKFQVELLTGYPDNDYVNNSQAWCYNVTVLAEQGDLSHWCLDLCDEPKHQVLSWLGPAERIEHTAPTWNEGSYGHIIKWDGTTLGPGESAVFCFTLAGIWESDQIEWFASDGAPWGWEDPQFADTGWTVGPSCMLFHIPSQSYNLTVSSTTGGSATATINPTTVIGPGETKTISEIAANTTVSLAADALAGYEFTNWTGNPINGITESATTVIMNDNYEITANFKVLSEPPVIPPGGIVVGWETFPINKLTVLSPWIALFAIFTAGIALLAPKRRKA